ncbi:MAG: hypothetical protein JWQ30_1099, partial [Sediminibacterium sp.]|nr:hypothetical protein [Sediminibacterium sp.]
MNPPPKIFFVPQIKEADKFTIQHEPISSIGLMERAASACTKWITQHFSKQETFIIVCGNGNNGGDGLAVARQLHLSGYLVQVYLIETNGKYTDDFLANREQLEKINKAPVKQILSPTDLTIKTGDIVIDALFGTGLSKPVTGLAAAIITLINNSGTKIIAIDMPSGLFADKQ